jgi:hypothetical protein
MHVVLCHVETEERVGGCSSSVFGLVRRVERSN